MQAYSMNHKKRFAKSRSQAIRAIDSIILGFGVIVFLSTLSFAVTVFAQEQKWEFVQSVGGLSVGYPSLDSGNWYLPVQANVSGLENITRESTTLNSGTACKEVKAEVDGERIYLTLITSVGGTDKDARCPSVFLGQIAAGKYNVYYRGPAEPPIWLAEIYIAR